MIVNIDFMLFKSYKRPILRRFNKKTLKNLNLDDRKIQVLDLFFADFLKYFWLGRMWGDIISLTKNLRYDS